jgi:hypothetical protein
VVEGNGRSVQPLQGLEPGLLDFCTGPPVHGDASFGSFDHTPTLQPWKLLNAVHQKESDIAALRHPGNTAVKNFTQGRKIRTAAPWHA